MTVEFSKCPEFIRKVEISFLKYTTLIPDGEINIDTLQLLIHGI
jgi:hypothetical protein